MADEDYYITKAAEMRQLAHKAHSPEACEEFLKLAHEYEDLAHDVVVLNRKTRA